MHCHDICIEMNDKSKTVTYELTDSVCQTKMRQSFEMLGLCLIVTSPSLLSSSLCFPLLPRPSSSPISSALPPSSVSYIFSLPPERPLTTHISSHWSIQAHHQYTMHPSTNTHPPNHTSLHLMSVLQNGTNRNRKCPVSLPKCDMSPIHFPFINLEI